MKGIERRCGGRAQRRCEQRNDTDVRRGEHGFEGEDVGTRQIGGRAEDGLGDGRIDRAELAMLEAFLKLREESRPIGRRERIR